MKTIFIEGMQCEHCKKSVEKVLKNIEGITDVKVNLVQKKAIIDFNNDIDNDSIKQAIEEEGFKVKEII